MPATSTPRTRLRTELLCLAFFLVVLAWSSIDPKDRFTWALEVFPGVIGAIVLIATHRRFRFTGLAYILMTVHACILCVGGHYTYAEVPLFDWLRDVLGLARNHYDRVGHFAQGFVPAIVAREVLLRTSPLRPGKWLAMLIICVCMAISAWYELLEWAVAALTGTAAEAFLGTQGDVWDTQKDMLGAFIGAAAGLATLSRLHNRRLAQEGLLIDTPRLDDART